MNWGADDAITEDAHKGRTMHAMLPHIDRYLLSRVESTTREGTLLFSRNMIMTKRFFLQFN
jgi:hypothetical protein